jgi:hypothetical protein
MDTSVNRERLEKARNGSDIMTDDRVRIGL